MPSLCDTCDLSTLSELSEKVVCDVLRARYAENRIYTLVGDILIFMNPFKAVNIFTEKEFSCFSTSDWVGRKSVGDELDSNAHIYSIGSAAFRQRNGDSAILISGESGAGKTESTKLLLQQFVRMSAANSRLSCSRVAGCLLAANPIMEAFGNARTTMNHNSSRFAKFVTIGLQDSALVSSEVRTYMLEKSRLVNCAGDEGNFHIFYYLCLSEHPLIKAARPTPDQLGQSLALVKNLKSLGEQYQDLELKANELMNSFDKVGFSVGQRTCLLQIVFGLLQLANVRFETQEADHTISTALCPSSEPMFKAACKQLGLKGKDARRKLLKTLISAKLQVNEEDIYSMFHEDRTRVVLNSCIKAVYSRLFDWIIAKINESLRVTNGSRGKSREIGVLDIFGFESLSVNSFEQLCINLANEQLQLFFTAHVINMEQQEYHAEGLDWKDIEFKDNQAVLDLFLEKPLGLLSLLNEESSLATGCDENLYRKMLVILAKKPEMEISDRNAALFTVQHYAGDVTYTIPGLVDKNRDRAPQSTLDALALSKNKVLVELLEAKACNAENCSSIGSNISKRSNSSSCKTSTSNQQLAVQFRNSLDFLLQRLRESNPYFVRCIKPNRENVSEKFTQPYVAQQIRYCGIAEAVRVRRAGYSVRCCIADAQSLFQTSAVLMAIRVRDPATRLRAAFRRCGLQEGEFAFGKTKIFLKADASRKVQQHEQLQQRRVVNCQKFIRGYLQRRRFARLKEEQKSAKASSTVQSTLSLCSEGSEDAVTHKDTIRWFKSTQRQQLEGSDYHLWFHGIISREESNRMLAAKQLGSFLIRISNTRLGFALSFKDTDSVKHYLIEQMPKGRFRVVGEKKVHAKLADLVRYHSSHSLRNCSTRLTEPVGQEQGGEADYGELFDV